MSGTPPALARLCGMDAGRLLDLFRRGAAEAVPDGSADGLMLLFPGTLLTRPVARAIRALLWRGKMFDAAAGRAVNRVLPFGWRAVPGRVRRDASRLDGAPCILLDYSRTSWIAWMLRDELRRIAPGLWLGLVFVGRLRIGAFALQFPAAD